MRKIISILAVVVAALVAASVAGASRSLSALYVNCSLVHTDNAILVFEAGPYGTGYASTDEEGLGGYWFGDGDNDDVTVSKAPCAATAPPNNPGTPNMCYSKFGSETLPFDGFTEAQGRAHLLVGDYWMAAWVPGNSAAWNNVGSGHAVCNPTGKATGGYRDYSGNPVSATDAAAIIAEGDGITIYPEYTG